MSDGRLIILVLRPCVHLPAKLCVTPSTKLFLITGIFPNLRTKWPWPGNRTWLLVARLGSIVLHNNHLRLLL